MHPKPFGTIQSQSPPLNLEAVPSRSACGAASLHVSPRGEAKWVRGPSGLGASLLARAGVLEQYVEHGKQAQRSPGGHMACFDRRVVRNAGYSRPRSGQQVFTRHETRDTNHGFCGAWGTEALQSCFFCPGLLGNSTGRRSPCGSRIGAPQALTDRKPLILRSLRNTNHETRVTAFMFFANHEARNTTHGFVFFTNHETRNMVSLVPVGTEALQSFFSGPGCVA